MCVRWRALSAALYRPCGARARCASWPGCAPGGAVPFLASPRKGTKERRPGCGALRFATGCTEACSAGAGKKELALFACGERGSDSFFSFSAPALQASAPQTGHEHSARFALPWAPRPRGRGAWALRWRVTRGNARPAHSLLTACEQSERRSSGPMGGVEQRRAGRIRKTDCLSPRRGRV